MHAYRRLDLIKNCQETKHPNNIGPTQGNQVTVFSSFLSTKKQIYIHVGLVSENQTTQNNFHNIYCTYSI